MAEYQPVLLDDRGKLLARALITRDSTPVPSATIAIDRGHTPASGPKRAAHARQAGLVPPAAEPGKSIGASRNAAYLSSPAPTR